MKQGPISTPGARRTAQRKTLGKGTAKPRKRERRRQHKKPPNRKKKGTRGNACGGTLVKTSSKRRVSKGSSPTRQLGEPGKLISLSKKPTLE